MRVGEVTASSKYMSTAAPAQEGCNQASFAKETFKVVSEGQTTTYKKRAEHVVRQWACQIEAPEAKRI